MDHTLLTGNGRLRAEDGSKDVTRNAHEYLFDPVVLGDDVTLDSVLRLVENAPVLRSILRRYDVDALLVEARGPTPPYPLEGQQWAQNIEYAELFRVLLRDGQTGDITGLSCLQLDGVGYISETDVFDSDMLICAAGDRRRFAFDLTSARHLVHLPLRFDPKTPIIESAIDSTSCGQRTETVVCEELTLAQLLDAVFGELTWMGPPSQDEPIEA